MAEFKMPEITVGEPCVWYPQGNRTKAGVPGLICKVYMNAVCLWLFEPDRQRPEFKEGVRHCDDPEIHNNDHYSEGGWEYSDTTLRLRRIEVRMNGFEKALEHNL